MKLNVVLGADQGGFTLKKELYASSQERYQIVDLGTHKFNRLTATPISYVPLLRQLLQARSSVVSSFVAAVLEPASPLTRYRVCVPVFATILTQLTREWNTTI